MLMAFVGAAVLRSQVVFDTVLDLDNIERVGPYFEDSLDPEPVDTEGRFVEEDRSEIADCHRAAAQVVAWVWVHTDQRHQPYALADTVDIAAFAVHSSVDLAEDRIAVEFVLEDDRTERETLVGRASDLVEGSLDYTGSLEHAGAFAARLH